MDLVVLKNYRARARHELQTMSSDLRRIGPGRALRMGVILFGLAQAGLLHAMPSEQAIRAGKPGAMGVQELLRIVRTTHPAVASRQADVEAADSSLFGAKLKFLPAPSIDRTDLSGNSATTARLEQPLFTGGRLMGGLDSAEAKAKISNANLSEVQLNLSLRTVTLYQQFVSQTGRLEVIDDGLQRLEALRQLIDNRSAAGASAEQDVELARSRIAQLQSERAAIQAQRQSVLAQLSQLLGRRLGERDLDPRPVQPSAMNLNNVNGRALANSPALMKSKFGIDAAKADEMLAQSALWPSIAFRTEYQNGQYEGSLQPGNRWYLVVNYVPGAGLSSIAEVSATRAKIRAAESEVDTTQREVLDRLQIEIDDYESARSRVPNLSLSTRLSKGQIESNQRLFVLGRRSWLDLLNSVRELVNVHQQEIEARAVLYGAYFRVGLIAGDLFPNDLANGESK